jgi:hypothetical protein
VGDAWTSILDFGGKYYVYDKIGPNYRENKLDDFLEERWKEKSATTVVDKVKTIHDWMNKHMKVEDLPENESTLSLITYVNNRKIDHQNLFKLYHYLLFRTSPDYALCMARDFYDGPIDFAFVAFHQINYILYSFKDEAGATHYVIPQDDDENKYELDEIDGRIQGTKYISMNLKNKNHEITNPKLPFNAPVDNTRSRMAKAELDLETGNAALKFDETIQGVYSTNARHFYMKNEEDSTLKKEFVSLMKERNETAQVDSISVTSYETTFPFTFKLNYHLTIGNVVSKVDEKLYAVSTEKWFYHTLDKVNPQTRNMDYYFPNLGRDIFKYYLVFPTNVSLVNGEKIKKSIQQPFSTYSLDITQVNPTTILVESSFQVRQVHVPLAEITKLSEMIQKIEEADNEPVMVKVL